MPGAYRPVDPAILQAAAAAGNNDHALTAAADCAMASLFPKHPSNNRNANHGDDGNPEQRHQQQPPPPNYSFLLSSASSQTDEVPLDHRIVGAQQQVVAGMNYQLTIVVVVAKSHAQENDDEQADVANATVPLGGFTVTVYDRFGTTRSVTHWGPELSLDEARRAWIASTSNNA
eukprot:CAMPEP_0168748022 /NCGR_PEP_ID=MMETSP0724-20121128/15960_1 /TAXON_ID=265536 /ORGANISM="Amphiprora sp., Strain CCMP467" /LENGTH=173 /DNA_ID=CAMNT_0008795835 /DNA_START=194 /DNA_END=715 /DNA_ORIENTATION=+